MDEPNDVDVVMSKEQLLNITVDYGYIRDVLVELSQRMEVVSRQTIDMLKNRDVSMLQDKLDEMGAKLANVEDIMSDSHGSGPVGSNQIDMITETMERRIEESRNNLSQLVNDMKNAINSETDQKIEDVLKKIEEQKDEMAKIFATIEQFEHLQAQIDEISTKMVNGSPRKKSVDRHSARNAPQQERASIRISEIVDKTNSLANEVENLKNVIDELKGRIQEVHEKQDIDAKSMTGTSGTVNRLDKQLVVLKERFDEHIKHMDGGKDQDQEKEKEVIIREGPSQPVQQTIVQEPANIDIEKLKWEITQNVIAQMKDYINESVGYSQGKKSERPEPKEEPVFTVSDQSGIHEEEKKKPAFSLPSLNLPTNSHNNDPRVEEIDERLTNLSDRVDKLAKEMKKKFKLIDGQIAALQSGQPIPMEAPPEEEAVTFDMMCSTGTQTFDDEEIQASQLEDKNTSPYHTPHENTPHHTPNEGTPQISLRKSTDRLAIPLPPSPQTPEEKAEPEEAIKINDEASASTPLISSEDHITPTETPAPTPEKKKRITIKPIPVSHVQSIPYEDATEAPKSIRSARPASASISARSNVTSQTYEELDNLTQYLKSCVEDLYKKHADMVEHVADSDRNIRQVERQLQNQLTTDALDQLRKELEERIPVKSKREDLGDAVTTSQLKRVVANFQNSLKTIDKDVDAVKNLVPQLVTRDDLNELVEAIRQAAENQQKELSKTAAGRLAYKCLLCGHPTNIVTGMITESEVAHLIGEPPMSGPIQQNSNSNDFVLVYGKEGSAYRASSATKTKRKTTPSLPRITPASPHINK